MTKKRQVRKTTTTGLRGLTPWLLLAAGFVTLFLLRGLVASLPQQAGQSPYLDIWLRVWLLIILGAGIACFYLLPDSDLRSDAIALLVGIWMAGILLLCLKDTSYALNGIGGDAGFQTAQVTKFAAYSGSVDFAYKDLPAFYPPLYFFLLGKAAALVQITPYKVMKYGLIAIVFLLPFLTRKIWSLIVPGLASFVLVFSALLFQDFYKPTEWLSLFLFVPWWIYFVEGVEFKGRKRSWIWFISGNLLGALIFTTYYYWFFIGGLSLLVRFALQSGSGKHLWASTHSWLDKFMVLAGAALFSLPYWGPYLWSMWATGGWSPLQNRYFAYDFVHLEFPFLQFSILGLALLVGLGYLLVTSRNKPLSRSLLVLLAGAYAWQVLGYFMFLLDSPLLTFKARDFVIYILIIAFLLAVYEGGKLVFAGKTNRQQLAPVFVGMAMLLPFYFGQRIGQELTENELLPPAKNEIYPAEFISEYSQAIGSNNYERVVLGDGDAVDLSIYLPVYQFVSWAAHYSHPAGLYYERIAFLQELSRARNPEWFAAAVMNNRYSHIDELILHPTDDAFTFDYRPDTFPYPLESEVIVFPEELIVGEFFSSKPVGERVLFSPVYINDPLRDLPDPVEVTAATVFGAIGTAEDMYIFLVDFGAHVEFENEGEYWSVLSGLFGNS